MNETKNIDKPKGNCVLPCVSASYLFSVGTKLHAKLVAQVKHFNDLAKYE